MSPEERAAVAELLRPVTFAVGEHLVVNNVVPPGLYVIEAGRVQFQIRLPGDTQQPVWEASAGEVMGELSLSQAAMPKPPRFEMWSMRGAMACLTSELSGP
jgi:hypothetical protein